ncbi:LOW QUALITY PROTEIN: cysteine-rich receptor-like protein kinase 10 [Carica papaya]|uniref:LOW QUALITY PROTEIN: cysteine-rich receptor-like protein kinase 10 n=1 Tax=Carica papaya TaxID=3649 RepID=UPI000B8CB363|nr:LOW QUALITY PROTEIN: cysteine-rich receptor-like protein kinase 10 [Carica papaya]
MLPLFLLLATLILFSPEMVNFTSGQLDNIMFSCPSESNNTASAEFSRNLDRLLSRKLYDEGGNAIFYSTTQGKDPDKVYGLYLCRGDATSQACQKCIELASFDILHNCSGTKKATLWYSDCLVRYSNAYFFSDLETVPSIYLANVNNFTGPDTFDQFLSQILRGLIVKASSDGFKFAVNETSISNSGYNLYSYVQCIPDLSATDCQNCTNQAASLIFTVAAGKMGARILIPSCSVRFEVLPSTLAPGPSIPGGVGRKKSAITAISISIPAAIVLISISGYILLLKRRHNKAKDEKETIRQEVRLLVQEGGIGEDCSGEFLLGQKQMKSQELPLVPLSLVLEATQHFCKENKLGEGGFGPVYKGTLVDGKKIAVKRLSKASGQGENEFKTEIILVAKLQHKNLVRLLGCCLERGESLLIYEYMPNKSLDFHLFDSSKATELNWKRRLAIIVGIPRGLLYLHEDSRLRIIHRDLKASNVLLDDDMNPKISDFGTARIFGGNQNEANTKRVVGTYGYMAPEYAMEGIFSVKSDVFSFGVLLLEIISGRKNNGFHLSEHGESLISYTWKSWSKGQGLEVMDPILAPSCVGSDVLKCIHIGLLCVQEDPADRPTMSSVAVMLASESMELPIPMQPAFSVGRVLVQPTSKADLFSINDATLSNVSPR